MASKMAIIRKRQKESIAAARKAGKKFGSKKALSVENIEVVRKRVVDGERYNHIPPHHSQCELIFQ